MQRSHFREACSFSSDEELSPHFLIYCISTVNTQHMQRPDVLVQLCYIWRHVSAVKRPSSGQQRIVLLRYSVLYLNNTILCWPEDGRLTAKHVARYNIVVLIHLVFAYVVY